MRTARCHAETAPRWLALLLPAAGLLLAGAPARADGGTAAVVPSTRARPEAGAGLWQAAIGLRASLLRDPGFDPFSSTDGLAQISYAVTRALGTGLGFVPALGLAVDLGGADATARGAETHLGLSRFAVVLEPRFVPRPGLYVAARIVPGLLRASATLRDSSAPVSLTTSYLAASIDASLGAGVRLNHAAAPLGLWLTGEGGYGWSPRHDLTLGPALPAGDAQKAGTTSLGSLPARGAFLRAGVALSY